MTQNTKPIIGHFASFGAYAIFGFNIICCKDIASFGGVSPIALVTFRSIGAAALFWLLSLALPREKVSPRDIFQILIASLMGLFIPQMTFLYAVTMTATIDTSILSSLTPIMTMFVAALVLKEPITWTKAGGVALSFAGVVFLILNSISINHSVDQTRPLGVILLVINTFCFAAYLGIFRPLISRYSVVTFMKWAFLFSLAGSLPFSAGDIAQHTDYAAIPSKVWWEIGYVIVFATFIAYFLIPLGQKHIRPTLVSMYGYLQPIIASVVAISLGMDSVSWQKVVATLLVFAGVALVNRSRAAHAETPTKRTSSESDGK